MKSNTFSKVLKGYHQFRKKYALGRKTVMQVLSDYGQQPKIGFPHHNGRGLSVFPVFVLGAANNSSNLVFTLTVSPDYGKTWTTTSPSNLTVAVPGNGTTQVVGYAFIPPTSLDNVTMISGGSIQNTSTNAGASATVSHIYVGEAWGQ